MLRCDVHDIGQAQAPSEGRHKSSEEAPAASPRQPVGGGGGFSLVNWQARLRDRCAHQKRPADSASASGAAAAAAAAAAVQEVAPGNGDSLQTPRGTSISQSEGRGRLAHTADLHALLNHFRSRDAGRMRRTVVPIASLMRAGEEEKAKELLNLARDGLLAIAREGWRVLQDRHPEADPGLAVPSLEMPVDAAQHAARPSRCPTYLLPRQTAPPRSSAGGAFAWNGGGGLNFKPGARRMSPAGQWKPRCESDSLESADTETSLAHERQAFFSDVSSKPGSESSVASAWTVPLSRSRLASVDVQSCESSMLDDDVSSPTAIIGHRDDWELQYTLSCALDEVYHRLSAPSFILSLTSRDALSDSTVNEAAMVLEKARERILEWLVKRWQTCHEENRQVLL